MKTTKPGPVANRTSMARPRKALALVIMAVLFAGSALAADAATGAPVTLAHPTRLQAGDAVLGALPLNLPIHVEVALRLRNKDALDAFIANNANSQSARRPPQLMTTGQFLANHAPTQAQAQKVADYLAARGYSNVTIAPNRLLVSADGTAATARDAFMTSFAQVRTADGRIAYANTDDVRVPAALADTVLAVVGLQDVHRGGGASDLVANGRLQSQGTVEGHSPLEFPWIYGLSNPLSNIQVGIVTDGNLNPVLTDLTAFATNTGIANPNLTWQVVTVNSHSSDTSHLKAWDVASQTIAGMAHGNANLIFFDGPDLSNADLSADYNAAVSQELVKVVLVPAGECETDAQNDGSAAADDAIFQAAVAEGVTFVAPSADAGADACGDGSLAPSWPASSQYVLAVGGTTLSGGIDTWGKETVWAKSGGSPSLFEPMPSWQQALGVPGTHRGVPDVVFDGNPNSGALVYVKLALSKVGGTYLSAAGFSAFWAGEIAQWGQGSGFAGPVIYGLPAADFHDITAGNNAGETASAGYDFASGRGSVIMSKALTDSGSLVNKPPVASFTLTRTGSDAMTVTDTSTDSDGTVVKHHWDFGDGATSTAANASHTYATDGVYAVVDTVTDNDGSTGSLTKNFVAGTSQVIGNPSFETGSFKPWFVGGISDGVVVTLDTNPADAFDGSDSASLNYTDTDRMYQKVTIPSGGTTATLTFHLWVFNGSLPAGATETLTVDLGETYNNASFATLATFTNADASSGYATYTYDMTPYIGQTFFLRFRGVGSRATAGTGGHFSIDDVTLTEQ